MIRNLDTQYSKEGASIGGKQYRLRERCDWQGESKRCTCSDRSGVRKGKKMNRQQEQPSQKRNNTLQELEILVGEWNMVGNHPMLPDPVRGRATFDWFEDGAFLAWHTYFEQPLPPNAMAVIGRDDSRETCTVLYFDVRGVSRVYEMSLQDGIWKMWRDAPDFRQRMTGTISDDQNTITVHGELSKDGSHWEQDLDLVYTRVR